jgi:uncharacterized membrane protein YhiD involved in acid resistance
MAVRNVWTALTQVITALVAVALVLFVMVLYWPLTQTNARQRAQLSRLQEEVRQAREDLAQKTHLRHALVNDEKTIEREIRTQFRYARSNETIVVFLPATNPPSPHTSTVP